MSIPSVAILAQLRDEAGDWITTDALARAVYGTDDWEDRAAIRQLVWRLRQKGHRIESRQRFHRNRFGGYRLLTDGGADASD